MSTLEADTNAAIATMALELDHEAHGCWDKIDLDTLDMADANMCIGGQFGWDELPIKQTPTKHALIWSDDDESEDWCKLAHAAWRHEILCRRVVAALPEHEMVAA